MHGRYWVRQPLAIIRTAKNDPDRRDIALPDFSHLDIPMNDAKVMQVLQASRNIDSHVQDTLEGERSLLQMPSG